MWAVAGGRSLWRLCDALKGTDSEVLAVDVNTRALELSGQNAKAAGYSVATFTPEQPGKVSVRQQLKAAHYLV